MQFIVSSNITHIMQNKALTEKLNLSVCSRRTNGLEDTRCSTKTQPETALCGRRLGEWSALLMFQL